MRPTTSSRLREIAYTALFAALLVICTWISVPTQPPFTMQVFAVFTASLCLGRKAAASVGVYLALGAVGVPVFAGMSGGIGHLVGPSGGFLLGFLPAAYFAGWMAQKSRRTAVRMAGCGGGMLLCYTMGTLWYAVQSGEISSVGGVLSVCVLPVLLPDALKILLAASLSRILIQRVDFVQEKNKKT